MANVEQISPTKAKKNHRNDGHHEKKRKRHTPESCADGTENPSNGQHFQETAQDFIQHTTPKPKEPLPSPDPAFSASTGKKRINPFSILAQQTETTSDANSPTTPSTPPQKHTSLPSSVKKVVQFGDEDDDDDDEDFEYTPSKRKKHTKLLSPRTLQSPKSAITSPKKVSRKDALEARVKELEYERRKLPIWTAREPLLKMIEENQVTILLGETGCGKSTQLPQFLLSKYESKGIIGITQPRRVAAVSLARRVAEEHGTILRNKVGYSIRFDDATSMSTRIKYLTDGMLLRELQSSPTLSAYSVIILDEAHERSLRTDLLMGLIKLLLPQRPELRVVVMSATLDAERFGDFFEIGGKKAQIGFVQGREYPVEIFHTTDLATGYDGSGKGDYMEGALKCIFEIHLSNQEGDILVFVTGQSDIESLESSIESLKSELPKNKDKLLVCPLYSALPPNLQYRAFAMTPHGTRKVILATNIAETSLTVPGVRFVIDTGVQKRRIFNPSLGIESLQVYKISKSSAAQRAGRAGREAKGTCYRLYPQVEFDGLKDNTTPEIRDCDIVSLVLTLKIQGHDDILNFPFLDRPKRDSVVRSLETLYLLGALGKDGKPTELGKQMDLLPLTPQLAKVLFSAARGEDNCVAEVIDIIACLSVSNANAIFSTSEPGKREEGTELRSHFASPLGDLITLLRAFREFLSVANHGVGVKEWCRKWEINWRAAKNAMEIQKQLISYCERNSIVVTLQTKYDADAILKAFLSGFILNTAFLQMDGSYRTSFSHHTVLIHPTSVLFHQARRKKMDTIMYHELVATKKKYVRGVSVIEGDWFQSAVPGLMGLSSEIRSMN